MTPSTISGERNRSLLARYTQRLGALVDRRTSQIALDAARREAEAAARNAIAASRAKTEFLANMSHALHTPLSSIIGFAEMMDRGVMGAMPEVYRGYARNILDSGQQLLGVVGDMLDMSQIETGKYPLAENEIDIAATVMALIDLMQGRAAQAGLYLQARLPEDMPRLRADPRAFKQIVANLLSNAIKYTGRGGRIYVVPALADDGAISLRVVDTGVGINEGDLARVVLPFERIGEALTRRVPGTGVGLSIVNALIGLHGGSLQLQSKVGVGTIATITFPPSRVVPAAAEPAPSEARLAGGDDGGTAKTDEKES